MHSRPYSVLVVDDNVDAADALAQVLTLHGFNPRTAADGHAALRLVAAEVPAAVLLDIGMPGMDGWELARRLRAEWPVVRLVAVTGYGRESDELRSDFAGIDLHLVKPVEPRELVLALRRLLDEPTPGEPPAN